MGSAGRGEAPAPERREGGLKHAAIAVVLISADELLRLQLVDDASQSASAQQRSVGFYRDVVGLPVALEVPERNAAFFWVGEAGRSMLGLWSVGSAPLGLVLHVAFDVALDDVLDAPRRLAALGIEPLSFFGTPTTEPSVIGWMPPAAVYFRDPDGHQVEFLAMLDERPRADVGIVAWSEWPRDVSQPRSRSPARSSR